MSFLITSGLSFLFTEKYTELKPDLFKYQFLTDLIPGLEAPNEPELLHFRILSGLLLGFGWIFIGTIIAPRKKFIASCVLFLLSTALLIRDLFFFPHTVGLQHIFAFITAIFAVIIIHPKNILKLLKSHIGIHVVYGLLIVSVFIFGLFFYHKKSAKLDRTINKKMELEEQIHEDRVALDMNGDGRSEMLINPLMVEDYYVSGTTKPFLTLYDSDGKKIARTPEWFGSAPNASKMDFVTPPKGTQLNDLAQIDVTIGPHQTESMFLKLEGDLLLPICKTEKPIGIDDCLFYNSAGELGVESGLMGGLGDKLAIIEFVDEYPANRDKLDDKTQNIIRDVFKEASESAIKIAEGELGSRGSRVVWNIYIFNGKIFEVQTDGNYDKYFSFLEEDAQWRSELTNEEASTLIKRSEMSQESIEYIEFVKDFWTGDKEQKQPVLYYAKLKRWSTSGDMRFYWYDNKTKQIVDSDDPYSWFFALPEVVLNDPNAADQWVKFIQNSKDSVFKITGTRLEDDCDYYGPKYCIESVDIKKIEVVETNKLMEF